MSRLLAYLSLLCVSLPLAAQTVAFDSIYAEGNTLYGEAQAAETVEAASALYQQAIDTWLSIKGETTSANLHYNMGNAYFQLGEWGRAALQYEKALSLDPGHPEARANLSYTLERNGIEQRRSGTWRSLSRTLNLDTWTWLAAGAFWLGLILWLVPRLYQRSSLFSRCGASLCGLIVLVSLAAVLDYRSQQADGIILQNDSPLKIAPTEASQPLAYLQAGLRARITQTYQNYYYIETRTGDGGWIANTHFAPIFTTISLSSPNHES